ncbi:MAG: adenylate/guanylate cyclase domain-containing protein [Candidatus Riflebacteria bacterium]|nr:adenylate/guanylate cyclase domain-containing protein [Candidatus Riflebacteria bacterium]
MTLHRSLAFALCFIIVLAFTIRLEEELGKSDRLKIDLSAQALQLNDRIRQEANVHSLVQKAFGRFRDLISINYKSLFRYGWPPDFLNSELPINSLSVALVDNQGKLLETANLAGDIDTEFIENFVRVECLKNGTYTEDVLFNPKHKSLLLRTDKLLGDFIGLSIDRTAFMLMRAGRLATFKSEEKLTGVYWDKLTVSSEQTVFFFCRLDLHAMTASHIYRTIVKSELDANLAVAFYDRRSKEFLVNSDSPVISKKANFDFIKKVCSDAEHVQIDKAEQAKVELYRQNGLIVVVGRVVAGTDLTPIVVAELESGSNRFADRFANVAFFMVICVALLLFVQVSVFARGLRLSVGKVLIIASLLAIFMPFLMGSSIFRLILREVTDSERLKIERNLHNILAGIDSGVRLYNANLFQSFLRSFAHPDTLRDLKRAREIQTAYDKGGPEEKKNINLKKMDAAVFEIAERAFAPFLTGFESSGVRDRRANAILIFGPNNFMRYYDRFKREVVGHNESSRTDSMFVLLNMYKKTVEKFFPIAEFVSGLSELDKNMQANEMEKFVYEEIKAQLVNSVGAERFYELFSNFEGLNNLRSSVGATLFSVFPLRVNGLIEYFCGVGWDEYAIGESYLKTAFANIITSQKAPHKLRSLFDLLDPASLIDAAPVLLQTHSGVRAEAFSSDENESAKLAMMIRSSSRSRRLHRETGSGEDSALYQVLPGRFLSLYTVGGRQDTSHLERIEFWRHIIFLFGMLIFVVFAVFAAVNISRSFTGPLEHLLWGLNMIESGNYDVKLKDSREDEFGSISRAFNGMVKGLRERNALGNFVSESVRRLARSPELFEKAQQGSEAKYTILFADLAGFTRFAAKATEEQVYHKLEYSLDHFFRYAEELGGEVDKVIGEKLLIVFSHEQHGKKNAAIAAIKLAKRMVAAFKSDKEVRPVFGINSGRVISGIIGTPEVRMDNTVIGDPVNVAARMCSLANSGDMPIVISGAIRDCLGASYRVKPVAVSKIRGKKQEVEVFSLEV